MASLVVPLRATVHALPGLWVWIPIGMCADCSTQHITVFWSEDSSLPTQQEHRAIDHIARTAQPTQTDQHVKHAKAESITTTSTPQKLTPPPHTLFNI
jgi:hypothetical protein